MTEIAVAVLGLSGFVFTRLGAEFVPQLDEGSMTAMVARANRMSLDASLELEMKTEKALLAKVPEVTGTFSRIGTSEVATDPMPVSANDLYISYKPRREWRKVDGRTLTKEELGEIIAKEIEQGVPGQSILISQPIQTRFNELMEGTRADIAVKIFGDDFDLLEKTAERTKEILQKIPGASEVEFEASGWVPMLQVEVDRVALTKHYVHAAEVNKAIATALGGQTVGSVVEGNRHFDIVVRMPESYRENLEELKNLPVRVGDFGIRPPMNSHDDDNPEHEHAGHDHGAHAHTNGESDAHGHDHEHTESPATTISLIASGILVGLALVLHWTHAENAARWISIGAMAAGGWFLLPSAWEALLRFRPDINLLVIIAAIGASVVGEWAEAGTVVFLFGVAEWLEGWADRRARRAVEALLEIAPKSATVKRAGQFVEVAVEEVKVGETVAVKSGMNIPLDGEVLSGQSAVNQAPITGESIPVEKETGDPVFAGTVNGSGSLELKVTKAAGDTTLARIIRLVKEAQEQKAPSQRFVDVFARYYTPAVTLVALLIFLVPPLAFHGEWSVWLYRACVLLIIACPCALVISTPVSIVAGLTALARRGVLVKGGAHLESIARLRALAVDKTGTITEGHPTVQAVEVIGQTTEDEVLRIAAAIDVHSSHPLSAAVAKHVQQRGIAFPRARDYQNHTGRGAQGVIDDHAFFVGNHRFTHELGVCSEDIERRLAAIEDRGQSVVVVGHRPHDDCKGEVLGILAVGDAVRANAADAVRALHDAGVEKIVMLSGDNQRTATFIARQVGIDEARGDLLPEDKVAAVKALRDRFDVVGMVGDGVNDAPAMATATVGIAMGAAGTDAAIETADVALMQDDLSKIAETIRLGRRTLGIIRFNIGFALALKLLFLVLALLGHTSLWLAIMADTGATLLVVANALRLLR